jgi:D-amino-acid dehydrogenase
VRIGVIGAGVVGVATAYFLHRAGHDVTVLERRDGPALETSHANAGHVCPSYATPWAAPGMPAKALAWSLRAWCGGSTPLRWTPRADRRQWRWLRAFVAECDAARYDINKARMGRIARYSRNQMQQVRDALGLEYHAGTSGNLQLFSNEAARAQARRATRVLADAGVPHRMLDRDGCIAIEPALARSTAPLLGGLLLPGDETGDCHAFTTALAAHLSNAGVVFRYRCSVAGLHRTTGGMVVTPTADTALEFDGVVVACATASAPLVRTLGLELPLCAVKGYSVTVPILEPNDAPTHGLMDEARKVAISRFGNCLRAAGTAEIGATDDGADEYRCATTLASLQAWFGHAVDLRQPRYWAGSRPMTPDGAPILGPTPVPGLFLATGGGSNGWTTACGVGRVVADLIGGHTPEIAIDDLTLRRFAGRFHARGAVS